MRDEPSPENVREAPGPAWRRRAAEPWRRRAAEPQRRRQSGNSLPGCPSRRHRPGLTCRFSFGGKKNARGRYFIYLGKKSSHVPRNLPVNLRFAKRAVRSINHGGLSHRVLSRAGPSSRGPLRAGEQIDDGGYPLEVRGWHPDELRQFDRCIEQGIRLQGLARLEVHEHRRLVVTDPRGALEAALDRDLRGAAQACGDLRRLVHHAEDQVAGAGVRGDLAHRRAGEDADRVERHVAHQL